MLPTDLLGSNFTDIFVGKHIFQLIRIYVFEYDTRYFIKTLYIYESCDGTGVHQIFVELWQSNIQRSAFLRIGVEV